MAAVLVDPTARSITQVPWDLTGVPHAHEDWWHISYSAGVDTRNHVLAARILGARVDLVTPFTIRTKRSSMWVAWIHDDNEAHHVHDGFKITSIKDCSVIWRRALVVKYGRWQGGHVDICLRPSEAERVLSQPQTLKPSKISCEWVHGRFDSHPRGKTSFSFRLLPNGSVGVVAIDRASICHKPDCGKAVAPPLKSCSRCRSVYCSRECQVADWRRHRALCQPTARQSG